MREQNTSPGIKYEAALLAGIFVMITGMIFPDLMITLQLLMRFPSGSDQKTASQHFSCVYHRSH